MEHTWESEFLPKLKLLDAAGGDIAVCSLLTEPAEIAPGLDSDRVAFVAPLCTRSDLEWLLRTLALHPHVRHLVVCGDDHRASGTALLALWEQGIDAEGRLPGSRGLLSPDLDAEAVAAIRGRVEIRDSRDTAIADVARDLRALPSPRDAKPAGPAARVALPERTVFLSRKTSFPIFSSGVGDAWLQLLNLALRIGTEKTTAAGDRYAEALNAMVTVELPEEEAEFPGFLDFDAEDFEGYYRHCAAAAASEGSRRLGCERLFDTRGLAQLEAAVERLKQAPDAHSGTLVLLQPDDLDTPDAAPSLVSATFHVTDGRLFGSFVLRATNVYDDWPLQALSLVRLHREVAGRIGVDVGSATFVLHSAQVYARDWSRAYRVLAQSFKRPLPLQVDPSGIFLFGNDGGKARAMLLDHDASDIFWEEAFDDPEDLSWYIIDVMPWLLPQHIRYVGQECASLMRAIRECECYEQG